MKKILLFLCLLLIATSCASVSVGAKHDLPVGSVPPVYYDGNDEPAASSLRTAEQHNE